MADTQHRRWTLEEYLAWEERQPTRNEFVFGRVRAMVGGTRRHNLIGGNAFAFLHGRLRGAKCSAYGPDMKIMIPNGNVRYADTLVDCGAQGAADIATSEPTIVIEVLSKSTAHVDLSEKLDDYQSIPSMRHILYVQQERAEGELWTREATGWMRAPLSGMSAAAELNAIGVTLPFSVLYDGVPLDEPQA